MKRVYFIKPIGFDGPIKIGSTGAVYKRKTQLNTSSPFPLEVVVETPGGIDLEKQFHEMFSHLRLHGEWFSASLDLYAAITALREGRFDFSQLPTPKCVENRAGRPLCCPETSVFARLGGVGKMARLLDMPATTIQSWKNAGHIPSRHQPFVMDRARSVRVELSATDMVWPMGQSAQ